VREVLLRVGDGPNLIQLLEPLTPESPVAKQIEKNRGREGLVHMAQRVADIHKAFSALKATVFFVHPKTTEPAALGYLVEVVQEA
jgi:methylmalonyl-CoA/ethylmalonyl-CoA epimerase